MHHVLAGSWEDEMRTNEVIPDGIALQVALGCHGLGNSNGPLTQQESSPA